MPRITSPRGTPSGDIIRRVTSPAAPDDPWTRTFYVSGGDDKAFDRVVFFSDAVFAIALTLMAVEIGVPVISDASSATELWAALVDKVPQFIAYVVAFAWVAFYWRANHRFTTTLRGMSGRYIAAVLVYLGLVALLPFPAGLLGEYWDNPVAVAVFAVFAATVSFMEVVLFVIADRQRLFLTAVTPSFRRQAIAGSLVPVAGFLVSIPFAFLSTLAAFACWFVVSVFGGWMVSRWIR